MDSPLLCSATVSEVLGGMEVDDPSEALVGVADESRPHAAASTAVTTRRAATVAVRPGEGRVGRVDMEGGPPGGGAVEVRWLPGERAPQAGRGVRRGRGAAGDVEISRRPRRARPGA